MGKCQDCKKEVKHVYKVTLQCILGEKEVLICHKCRMKYPVTYFEENNEEANHGSLGK